jgi:hypothetical protein
MSYNILKSKVNFVGDDTPEIEGMVDTSSDQTISGSKNFEFLTGSNVLVTGSLVVDGELSATQIISHVGDSDTKIQFSNDAVFITAGGVSVGNFYDNGAVGGPKFQLGGNSNFFVPGTGKVGIGTSVLVAPEHELVVTGTIAAAGQITCSLGITASQFHGDGSQLSNLGQAGSVLASNINGTLSASQIDLAPGLTSDAGFLKIDRATDGGLIIQNGLKVDIGNSTNQGSFNNSHYILVSGSTIGNRNLQLSVLESGLDLAATQISSGKLDNDRMPNNISVSQLSASTTISGAYFEGDGSGLTGVTGNPTPGGANTEIQFNDDDSLTGSPDLTFLTGSETLATTNISASLNISGSSLYLQEEIIVGGQTFLDIEGDVLGGNASFIEITASSEISSSRDIYAENFRGNGNTLNNVPLGTYANSNIVFCDNTVDTITSNGSLRWTGTQLITAGLSASSDVYVGGFVSASSYASAGGTLIDSEGNFQGNNASFNEITASSVVSSSAEISASSFHGDGSALTNVSADPQFRYYNYNGYLNVNTGYQWMYSRTNNTGNSNPATSVFLKWMAPGSGSIVRWVITPLNTTDGANGGYVETSFLKNNITQNANTLARTAHVTGAFDITRTIGGVNVSSSVIDWTGTNLTVSGTNAFDPGDTLLFGVKAENNHGNLPFPIINTIYL